MREIKFRGKRIDTEDWVTGFYAKSVNDRAYIIVYATEDAANTRNEIDFLYIEVIPETVGQFTGLKDKNGKEIYEGDVVFDRWANAYTPVFQNGIYMAYNPKNLMQNDPSTQFNIIWKNGCEVIGNIHEKDGDS